MPRDISSTHRRSLHRCCRRKYRRSRHALGRTIIHPGGSWSTSTVLTKREEEQVSVVCELVSRPQLRKEESTDVLPGTVQLVLRPPRCSTACQSTQSQAAVPGRHHSRSAQRCRIRERMRCSQQVRQAMLCIEPRCFIRSKFLPECQFSNTAIIVMRARNFVSQHSADSRFVSQKLYPTSTAYTRSLPISNCPCSLVGDFALTYSSVFESDATHGKQDSPSVSHDMISSVVDPNTCRLPAPGDLPWWT